MNTDNKVVPPVTNSLSPQQPSALASPAAIPASPTQTQTNQVAQSTFSASSPPPSSVLSHHSVTSTPPNSSQSTATANQMFLQQIQLTEITTSATSASPLTFTSPSSSTSTFTAPSTTFTSTSSSTPSSLNPASSVSTFKTILNQIKQDAESPPYNNYSTQKLIRTLMKQIELSNVGVLAPTRITSEFVTDTSGKVIVEPYTLTIDGKEKTFYKLKATYTVPVEKNAEEGVVEFTRPIYTTATNPETAIFAAAQYKEAVIQLAQAPIDDSDYDARDTRVKNYNQIPKDKRALLDEERSFRFHFSYDTNGKPKSVDYFHADIQNQSHKIEWGAKSAAPQKYVRERQELTWGAIGRPIQNDMPPSIRRILYPSETEALLDTPYVIPQHKEVPLADEAYIRLGKTPERLAELQAEVEKKEKEMKDLQEKFKKKPFFGSLEDTTGYKDLKAGIQALELLKGKQNIPDDLKTLSPTKYQLATSYQQIKNALGNDAEEKLVALKLKMGKLNNLLLRAQRNSPLDQDNQTLLQSIQTHYHAQPQILDAFHPTDIEINTLLGFINSEIKDIESKKQHLPKLKEELKKEQTSFNRHLFKLEALNQELQNALNELESFKQGAQQKISAHSTVPPNTPSQDVVDAQKIVQHLTQQTTSLTKKIDSNKHFINTLITELALQEGEVLATDILPVNT